MLDCNTASWSAQIMALRSRSQGNNWRQVWWEKYGTLGIYPILYAGTPEAAELTDLLLCLQKLVTTNTGFGNPKWVIESVLPFWWESESLKKDQNAQFSQNIIKKHQPWSIIFCFIWLCKKLPKQAMKSIK